MAGQNRRVPERSRTKPAAEQPKIVAQMPQDPEIQAKLQEMKENDGYSGSCGI
jgi:hypothetical protein